MFSKVLGEVVWIREFAVGDAGRWYEHEVGETPACLQELAGLDRKSVKKVLPVGYGLEITLRKLSTKSE